MNLFNTHVTCFLCNASLAVWNTHTCTRCGKKMCSHHAHLLRMPHSYVLSSVCVHCFDHTATSLEAHIPLQPRMQFQSFVGHHGR